MKIVFSNSTESTQASRQTEVITESTQGSTQTEVTTETTQASTQTEVTTETTQASTQTEVTTETTQASTQNEVTTETMTELPTTIRRDIECRQNYMIVVIANSQVPNSVLTLHDPLCRLENNGSHHVIAFTYDKCGTNVTSYSDRVNVQNEIKVQSALQDVGPIEFFPAYTISLQCDINITKSVHGVLQVQNRDRFTEYDKMASDFAMKEFSSDSYQEEITQNPVSIQLNREVFFELSVINGKSKDGIRVSKCVATPTPDANDTTRYLLVTNGCSASPAVKIQQNVSLASFRFSVQAFLFAGSVNQNNMVYVHCEVSACQNAACNYACSGNKRTRRSVNLQKPITMTSGGHFVAE